MPPAKQMDDFPLTTKNIAELENNAQVTKFFAMLGYDVDGATKLQHANMSMDTEDLLQRVTGIWQIATTPDEEIRIILFEVRSVTVALTQTIAQHFRQRPGYFLLVLTSDYETLDFVLLERVLTEGKGTSGLPRSVIRPRILTVNRRNPGVVALRVLKRFTYTEADGLYQSDKLRSAYSLAEWSEPDFNNRALFSDYYLKHRLTDKTLNPAWAEDVRKVGGDAIRLIAGARERLAGDDEQRTRNDLIEPLFKLMGFTFTANEPGNSGVHKPDYSLSAPGKDDKPLAQALVYKWNRNLDSADPERDPETPNENPGALVVSLLEIGETPWVILTNGKLWRLYSATASNKITNYYEIDLEEALFAPDHDREAAFKYWWLMFRREAFMGFLDKILIESQDYAKQIGERLKDRIFKQIFGYFASGFIVYLRDQGVADAEIDRDRVFHATMTFLYRLMFVLYAESLELVPVKEESGYGAHSLKAMKTEIAHVAGKLIDDADGSLKAHYDSESIDLFAYLRDLFAAIDKGDAAINLPVYNGGLFSPDTPQGQFLDQYAIPDVYLAIGLDRLARDVDDKTHELVFIDFKSLGVRQLGSIYEGLLEFKLRIADEKLVVIKDGKREIYMPYRQAVKEKRKFDDADVKDKGDIYIANTRLERKATGSYYTPDYIVKYIVEHTVGPVLIEKFAALRPRLHEAQKLYRQHKASKDAQNRAHPNVFEDPEKFWNNADMQQLADDCLSVRVLDPAMGSGHFLVEVVDYTSNRLIDFLNGWSENPVWALLEHTRRDILEEMERQGVSIDPGKLTNVVLLKRSVLKRCVYGVDLNEMAVELAKVSLWLDAFTLGAPLSFLDHHLKWGNSLIGARIEEVQHYLSSKAGETLDMFSGSEFAGVMLATDLMRQVSYLSDNTISQTQRSRDSFRDANRHLAPYKRMLDVYTSRWFGNGDTSKKTKTDSVKLFLKQDDVKAWLNDPTCPLDSSLIAAAQIGQTALQTAEGKRFFHWELEFPEVFFAPSKPGAQDVQLRTDGGFDAIVGNPPYVRSIRLKEVDSTAWEFYSSVFTSAAQREYDIYLCFAEQGQLLLNPSGYSGMIFPNKWFTTDVGESLRKMLTEKYELRHIVDFGSFQIFADATTYTCLLFLCAAPQETVEVAVLIKADQVSEPLPGGVGEWHSRDIANAELSGNSWSFVSGDADKLFAKFSKLLTLQEIGNVFKGIGTSADHVFMLAGASERFFSRSLGQWVELEASVMKPALTGRNIDAYWFEKHEWLLFPYSEHNYQSTLISDVELRTRYPKAWNYLSNPVNKDLLEMRERGEYSHRKDWYAHVYPRNIQLMSKPKIVFPDVAGRAEFAYDNEGHYIIDTAYALQLKSEIKLSLLMLSALLNSRMLTFFLQQTGTDLRGGYFRMKTAYLNPFPIPSITFTTSPDRRAELAEKSRKLYERCLNEGHTCVLEFVAHHVERDETDVIHDLLAFLAQQMMDLNKRKQAEVKRFLTWLENRLHIQPNKDGETGIYSLTGKTIIQDYLGDYQEGEPETAFEDFYFRLHQNHGRFGVTLTGIKAEIEDEYQKSLDVLLPIKRQLATTDALIDRVVYQLYGLTDEEIKLIEYPQLEQAVTSAREEVLKDEKIAADPEAVIEKVAEKVEQAAGQYLARVDEQQIKAQLKSEIAGWDTLPDNVRTFLITGDLVLKQSTLPDYSPVVMSYGKAAEVALNDRLFIPFREAYSSDDCANPMFKKFMMGDKTLSLGSMPIVLASSAEKTLRAFVLKAYPNAAQTILNQKALLAELTQDKIDKYRNSAAHDAVLTADDAKEARQWAIEILGYV